MVSPSGGTEDTPDSKSGAAMRAGSNPALGTKEDGLARRKKSDADHTVYIATPDRQLETPSGWCITKDHDRCPYQFSHGKCGCKCHKEKK